jgi:tagatose-1,6-bisphosphate aldolase non-catalytic subunit AgaZ/GatZ
MRRRLSPEEIEAAEAAAPKGVDIEILDRARSDIGVIAPSAVRINGTEIPIPGGTKIQVHEISEDELVTITLTVFARSVSIRHEPPPTD